VGLAMRTTMLTYVGVTAFIYCLCGGLLTIIWIVASFIYLALSDHNRIEALEHGISPLVCVALGPGPGRICAFGDCLLASFELHDNPAPHVCFKANRDGVLLSPPESEDAGLALPMGSFWTRSYTDPLAGMARWQVQLRYFIYMQYTAIQCAKIVVQRKKTSLPSVQLATVVLATLPSGEVLITKRCAKNMGKHDSIWVFPGTVVKVGHSQTVEEAARCEFIKETGITLHPDSVHPLALWQAQDLHSGKAYLVVCLTATISGHNTVLSAKSGLKMHSSEVATCAFLSPDAWPHLLPEKVKFQNQTRPMHKEIHPRAEVDDEVDLDTIASTLSGVHQFALHQLYLKTNPHSHSSLVTAMGST